ncbi:MAG: hypothetical protein L0G63_07795, partial [Psychrobacter sp.]|uniref:hypothetical protein n=1 Tax=Psychrobacter sp. TaxID=56811 RepID=UPI002648DE7D
LSPFFYYSSILFDTPPYFFSAWVALVVIIFLFYNSFWEMIVDVVYLKGFFNPSIYTTLFSLITLIAFLVSWFISFIVSRNSIFLALLNSIVFFIYFGMLITLTNNYLQFFEHLSIPIREQFHNYSYMSIIILGAAITVWLVRYCQYILAVRIPIWVTILFAMTTIVLFAGWWIFVDLITSM